MDDYPKVVLVYEDSTPTVCTLNDDGETYRCYVIHHGREGNTVWPGKKLSSRKHINLEALLNKLGEKYEFK